MFCFRFVYKLIFVDLNSKRYTLFIFFFLNKGNVEVTQVFENIVIDACAFMFRLRFLYGLIFVDLNLESVYI